MPENFEIDLEPSTLRMLCFLSAIMCLILGAFMIARMVYDPEMQEIPALSDAAMHRLKGASHE